MLRVPQLILSIFLIFIGSVNWSVAVNLEKLPGELCNRVCQQGETPKICYFKFHFENYQAMGVACGNCGNGASTDCSNPQCVPVDGVPRGIMTINRQIPGPAIHVCQNDLIVIDVINNMMGSSVTMHMHGLTMSDTVYMDGVPFITQCPIEFSTTFRYAFYASDAGTHFGHGHSGHQKVNGLYMAIIVRRPKQLEPNNAAYEFDLTDNIIFISDWSHQTADMLTPGLASGISPDSLLINGHGQFLDKSGKRTTTPFQVYKVDPSGRYRFRIICALNFVCPVQVQVESHKMQVIASDGADFVPVEIDTLFCAAGERYDIIINTNQPSADYWIRARLIGACEGGQIEQFAILRYGASGDRSVPSYTDKYTPGRTLNFPSTVCFDNNPNDLCITELVASVPDQQLKNAAADVRFYLVYDNYFITPSNIFIPNRYINFMNVFGSITFVSAINQIQFQFPSFPPLTQPFQITNTTFCDVEDHPEICGPNKTCPCTHRIKVNYGEVVELVLVDGAIQPSPVSHVFHLHGYKALVTNMGQGPVTLPPTRKLSTGLENDKTLPDPPADATFIVKDTVSIPSQGYVKLKFRATNQGLWLLHCFLDWHTAAGMVVVLEVGYPIATAPFDFPKCGSFLHPILDYT